MTKRLYCLGFMFNEDLSGVVLIRKTKPAWQAGLLNGVGGKLKSDESWIEAMVREWREETGGKCSHWVHFAEMTGQAFRVACFSARSLEFYNVETKTEEEVLCVPVDNLREYSIIPNVRWLVPMARDVFVGDKFTAKITYRYI